MFGWSHDYLGSSSLNVSVDNFYLRDLTIATGAPAALPIYDDTAPYPATDFTPPALTSGDWADLSEEVGSSRSCNGDCTADDPAKIVPVQVKFKDVFDEINGYGADAKQATQDRMSRAYLGVVDFTNADQQTRLGNLEVLRYVGQPRGVDGVQGSFASALRFTVADPTNLTNAQKVSYFLQTVKITVGAYEANGTAIAEQTIYLVEGFRMDANGKAVRIDTHRSELMRADFNAGAKAVAYTSMSAEATIGLGAYDGKALTGDYAELYKSGTATWDPTKIKFTGATTSYTVQARMNADHTWTFKDTSLGVDIKGKDNKLTK